MSLLRISEAASEAVHRNVFLFREDLYWHESLGHGLWSRISRKRPDLVPTLGGNKIRMLERLGLDKVQGTIYVTGATQSNLVRQVAAYLAMIGSPARLEVMVKPDGCSVDPDEEMERGNLATVRRLYPNVGMTVLASDNEESRTRLEQWITRAKADPSGTFIPRGAATQSGFVATTTIGTELARAMHEGALPRDLLVIVVSSVGTTHLGVARGISETSAKVVGLTTRTSADHHAEQLRWRDPIGPSLHVDDAFSVSAVGGATRESDDSVTRWSHVLGVEVDRQYCGRLCLWMDRLRDEGYRPYRGFVRPRGCPGFWSSYICGPNTSVVLVVTGLEQGEDGER